MTEPAHRRPEPDAQAATPRNDSPHRQTGAAPPPEGMPPDDAIPPDAEHSDRMHPSSDDPVPVVAAPTTGRVEPGLPGKALYYGVSVRELKK